MTTTQTETQPIAREDYTESRRPVFEMLYYEPGAATQTRAGTYASTSTGR